MQADLSKTTTASSLSVNISDEATTYLSDIGLTFGSGSSRVEVIREVNLELRSGDFVCVLGESGWGKTTLLRVLAGYQHPTAGSVTVSGKKHTKPNPDVGVVLQRPNLFPWLMIANNVEFGPKMRGVAKLERKQRASRYLHMVGLQDSAKLLPYQLFRWNAATGCDRADFGR